MSPANLPSMIDEPMRCRNRHQCGTMFGGRGHDDGRLDPLDRLVALDGNAEP